MIALIDDDPASSEAIARLLASLDLTVRTFASARAFLDHEVPGDVRLIISDIQMPGMSGIELYRQRCDRGDPTPVILISGRPDALQEVQARAPGVAGFLAKPVDDEALAALIREILAPPASGL